MAAVAAEHAAPAATPRASRKLRVAVLADAPLQPRWAVEALDKIARADFAEIVAVRVVPGAPRPSPPEPFLWRVYGDLDRWIFGDDLSTPVSLPNWGSDPELNSGSEPQFDVAFLLGNPDAGAIEARYGVWRFFFGEPGRGDEALAGLREVVGAMPVSGSGLVVRPGDGGPARLAYQSWSRTYPLSVARHRAHLLRKTSEFAWRALRELHERGEAWLEGCPPLEPVASAAPRGPRAGDVAGIAGRIARRGFEKALYLDQWFLAWRFGAATPSGDLAGFTRALPPKDRIWADPFVIEKHGRHFVFFEELPFAAGKAHIAMMEVRRGGAPSEPLRVLEREHHLSYPFLLEEGGELYMIPESAQAGAVHLYRCVDFPLRWKLERVLLEGMRLVDATFHRTPERWWMFANAAASGSKVFDDELHLFHAASLHGPWRAHPCNPVKSDVRSARPAGALYRRGGELYRPAQICTPLYGSGLSINQVVRLTPYEFEEREVQRILPGAGLLGLHTLNRAGDLTVVDAFTRRSRFRFLEP